MKTDESKLYAIELTDDERMWLSELVDNRAHELNKLLIGAIGDDREAWLTEINIADRVNEEGCLQVPPTEDCLVEARDSEHAAALAKAEERVRELEEAITVARAAMMHPLDEWKGQVERTALDVTRAALEGK